MKRTRAKRVVLVLAAFMSFAAGIKAQEDILTTESRRLSNGSTELAVTNNSQRQMVTAFVLVRQSSNPERYRYGPDYHDVLFTSEQHNFSDAIMPLETRRFRSPASSEKFTNDVEELKAAVFSDGTTWGDPKWVQRILECRRYYHADLGLAIQKIKKALDADTPVEQLRQEFEQLRDLAPDPGEDFEHFGEAKAAGSVFGTVLGHLPQTSIAGQDPNRSLVTFLPVLATWQMVIGRSKPSIFTSSE